MRDYAMYTDKGNAVVDRLVALAREADLSWAETYALMELVSQLKNEKFGEIMDTAVREVIYDQVARRGESFYL